MRDAGEKARPKRRRRLKYPGRFITFLLLMAIIVWMIANFVIALVTGQKFNVLGNGGETVRNIVVAGVDEGGYRTDLILLCQVNKHKGETNILQIPRDTKVKNRRNDKKINSAYFSGFECMSDEIEQVTGIRADEYVIIGFDAFSKIINSMGGVTVDVPIDMYYTDPVQDLTIDLDKGKQKLNGEQAQMFMRFRQNNNGTGYVNGDTDRIEAQKLLYDAVSKKMLSPAGILRSPIVFGTILNNCDTNMTGGDIFAVCKDVLGYGAKINFHTLPGGGRYIGGGSYFVYDVQETANLIDEYFEK